jgi:hypothetical protein
VPYARLKGSAATAATVHHLAKHLVHWKHAEVHLRDEYPNVGPNALRKAYDYALRAVHGKDDPRVGMVCNPDLRIIQGENTWFDLATQKEVRVTEYTLTNLPGLLRLVETTDKHGNTRIERKTRAPLLDRAKSGIPIDAYKPCRFVRGLALHEDQKCLQLAIPPETGAPVRLLSGGELLPEVEAFGLLAQSFPGLDSAFLIACLTAAICADKGGRPPIIAAVGPTGSGKGETPRLAASFLADDRRTLGVSKDEEKNWRRIGTANEQGHRFLA